MPSTMLVRHFMTRHVVTVKETLRCREALELFQTQHLRRAPVMRGETLIGMVGLTDLVHILAVSVADLDSQTRALHEKSIVAQVMSTKLITLTPDEHLEDAAHKMLTHKVGALPVLLDGKLDGLLTESDIFRAFVGMTAPRGELRITFTLAKGANDGPDPILVALRLGFRIRSYLVHSSPGGEEMAVMRLRGRKKRELIEALGRSGYSVIEVQDTRVAEDRKPAA
jgi:CBS domain-containing protein